MLIAAITLVSLSNHTVKKNTYLLEIIISRTTTRRLMIPLCNHLINKVPFWLASVFYSQREKREVLCDCCGTRWALPAGKYSLPSIKLHSGSVLQSVKSLQSFFRSPLILIAVHFNSIFFFLINFWEEVPCELHKDTVIYHWESSRKHYPHVQKQTDRCLTLMS